MVFSVGGQSGYITAFVADHIPLVSTYIESGLGIGVNIDWDSLTIADKGNNGYHQICVNIDNHTIRQYDSGRALHVMPSTFIDNRTIKCETSAENPVVGHLKVNIDNDTLTTNSSGQICVSHGLLGRSGSNQSSGKFIFEIFSMPFAEAAQPEYIPLNGQTINVNNYPELKNKIDEAILSNGGTIPGFLKDKFSYTKSQNTLKLADYNTNSIMPGIYWFMYVGICEELPQ